MWPTMSARVPRASWAPTTLICRTSCPVGLMELLTGKLDAVLKTFEEPMFLKSPTPAARVAVATAARYLRNNADFMQYADYLAKGWPIATGVIEGACGFLVKDRMERAGMKWRPSVLRPY